MKKMLLLLAGLSTSVLMHAAIIDESEKEIFNVAREIYQIEHDYKKACLDHQRSAMDLLEKHQEALYLLNDHGIEELQNDLPVDEMLARKAPKKIVVLIQHLREGKDLSERHGKRCAALESRLMELAADSIKKSVFRDALQAGECKA